MKALIIPSAKLVGEGLQSQFGMIPTILTPLNGKTTLKIIYDLYKDVVDKIIVVGKEKCDEIEKYIKVNKLPIELVRIDEVLDLGYSIAEGIRYLFEAYKNEDIDQVIINLADTVVENISFETLKNTLVYSRTTESKRWTTFQSENNELVRISDKENLNEALYYNSFVGVYSFNNPQFLFELLNDNNHLNGKMDSFYSAIYHYNKLFKFELRKTNKWLDVGHFDKYLKSKKDVKARFFNTISIDKQRGLLTKRSEDKSKFYNEILWYIKLPGKIQYIAPRIFNYSLDYKDMFVTMEYYGYSTLNELFVFGDLDIGQWDEILNKIFFVIEDMKQFRVKVSETEIRNSIDNMYLKKTIERMNKLRENEIFKSFFNETIIINGKKYNNLDFYINKLNKTIVKYGLYDINEFNIIHGDLCFSNILYDMQSALIRVIDPRGKFGDFDIYGDVRYDIAKLSHSINGRYDYIINDMFDLKYNGTTIEYKIYSNENCDRIEELFSAYLEKYNFDSNQIKLIEALLFLSMIPLHSDHVERQFVMLATGLKLIDELMEEVL